MHFYKEDINLLGYLGAIMTNILGFLYINLSNADSFSMLSQNQAVAGYNSIYYVLMAIPFIFLINNKFHVLLFSILPLWAFIESQKTTCILTGIVMLLYYFYSTLKAMGIMRKSVLLLVVSVSIFLIFQNTDFSETFLNIKDDIDSGGNGRSELALQIIDILYNDSSAFELLLGHGANSIVGHIGLGAHNDFLETLFNFGIIGLILYLSFWRHLIKNIYKFQFNNNLKKAYIISLITFFFASAASKLLETQVQMLLPAILWGILLQANNVQHANRNYYSQQ